MLFTLYQSAVNTVTPCHTETTNHRDLELFESRSPKQNNETWGMISHMYAKRGSFRHFSWGLSTLCEAIYQMGVEMGFEAV